MNQRVQLGKLFENTGKLAASREAYETALVNRPDYAYALAGMGRLSLIEKNAKEAIRYFSLAEMQGDDPTFKDGLAEAYELGADKIKSVELKNEVIKSLLDHQHGAKDNKGHFHAGMELAYAYLEVGDTKNALENAKAEYQRRPRNIDVNECLAWAYFKNGETAEAKKYISPALSTGSTNPRLLARAAMIYKKSGDSLLADQLTKKISGTVPELQDL